MHILFIDNSSTTCLFPKQCDSKTSPAYWTRRLGDDFYTRAHKPICLYLDEKFFEYSIPRILMRKF